MIESTNYAEVHKSPKATSAVTAMIIVTRKVRFIRRYECGGRLVASPNKAIINTTTAATQCNTEHKGARSFLHVEPVD
jgi:hypothetical protein